MTPGSNASFVVATEWLDDGTPVVSVMGELDLATAPTLEGALFELADDRPTVVVDLRACSFIDSTNLKVLIAAGRGLNRSGRELLLVICNPCVLRTFQITRFDVFFKIYPSLALALDGDHDG